MKVLDYSVIERTPLSQLTIFSHESTEHAHTFFEFTLVLDGRCYSTINGGKTELLSKGMAYFIRPCDRHKLRLLDRTYRHRDFYVTVERMKQICGLFSDTFYDDMMRPEQELCLKINADEFSTIERKARFFNKENLDTPIEEEMLKNLHTSIIIDFLSIIISKNLRDVQGIPKWLETLFHRMTSFDYINMTISEIISTTEYSHGYVCMMFKKHYNTTLVAYQNRMKILYSCNLLSQMKVIEIATLLGWENPKNYNIEFKKVFHMTPSRYKEVNGIKSAPK